MLQAVHPGNRRIRFALFSLLLLQAASGAVAATIRVGAFDYYPGVFREKDGHVVGFYADLLAEVARSEDWTIEYVYGTWSEGLERLQKGEVDLLTSVAYTEERDAYLNYGKEPLLTVWSEVYAHEDSSIRNLFDLEGKRVAVMRSDFNAGVFRKHMEGFSIHCQYIELKDFSEVFTAIRNGNADAGVVNSTFGTASSRFYAVRSTDIVFNPFPIFFAAAEGQQQAVLETLDRHLRSWRSNNDSLYYRALKKWMGRDIEVKYEVPQTFWHALTVLAVALGAVVLFNIILRNRVQRAVSGMRASEERTRLFFERQLLGMAITSREKEWTLVNDRLCQMLGYSRAELTRMTWPAVTFPEDLPAEELHFGQILEGAINEYTLEKRFRRKDGGIIHANLSVVCVRFPDGRVDYLLTLIEDITERKRTETALRDSEERFRSLAENLPGVIYLCKREDRRTFLYISDAIEHLTGYPKEDFLSRRVSFSDLYHPEDQQWMLTPPSESPAGNGRFHFSYRIRHRDGTWRWVYEMGESLKTGGQTGLIEGFLSDQTEKKRVEEEHQRLQEQFNQAQKIESVGRLAGGVAHDFNNMLGVILGHAELAMDKTGEESAVAAHLREIQGAAERSAELTQQLLAFARKQTVLPKVLNLNESIAGMCKMLQRLIGEDVNLNFSPDAALWNIEIDPSQVGQILINLCVNARDAIAGVGTITIDTANVALDEAYCATRAGFLPGHYVCVTVRDTGCGMDKETLAHIFEPFFTTKPLGRGTGLGLSTVYGIVKQNHGLVDVCSEPGQGSVFVLYFPRYTGGPATGSQEPAAASASPGRAEGTILVVEDEVTVLYLVQTLLTKEGYNVLVATSPQEALQIAEHHPASLDLLVTDVVMPEMNGRELAQALRARYPGLKRLYMSGYTADVIEQRGLLEEGVFFLQKPFDAKKLASSVRAALRSI